MDRVADFYNGKSVLLTGATGYLGEVLLEALLRRCPGINTIYGVIREKRGKTAQERAEDLFKKRLFEKLQKECPERLQKFRVLPGDVSQPDFNLSPVDLDEVTREVTILIHMAASVTFNKPLRFTLIHNCMSVQYAIDIAKKLKTCDVFIYTSSASSNSNRCVDIKEIVYRLPFETNTFIEEIQNGTEESLSELVSECQPAWPNFYTFSKCLAENILLDNAGGIKVAIVRPFLVGNIWKEPMKGYIEDSSGLTSISIGVGKGFLRVIRGDPDTRMDVIPVDVVSNAHIIVGYLVGRERVESPYVLHSVMCGKKSITFGHYIEIMLNMLRRNSMPNSFQHPNYGFKIIKNSFLYNLVAFYEHYLPGYVLDMILKVKGKKPKIVPLYEFVDKALISLEYFLSNCWNFERQNMDKIDTMICQEDREIFYTNMDDLDLQSCADSIPLSSPFYEWTRDKRTRKQRKAIVLQRTMLITFIKRMAVLLFILLLYRIFR